LLATVGPAAAAETFDIPVVLPLTGGAAFLGQGEKQALELQEKLINGQGGLKGTALHYIFSDDQSSPQTAVQLAAQITARHPSVIMGSAIVAMCNAMAPLVTKGPVQFCLSPGIHPKEGSFVFTSFISTHDLAKALIAYYRGRGFTQLAMITSTDASGQDGAQGFEEALALPENKGLKLVATAHFNPTDVSVSAQIEQIKAAKPQALIVWTSGAPFGTVLKGVVQGGLDIPVGTTDANMTYAQMKQYAAFLPDEMLYMSSEWPPHDAGALKLPAAVDKAQAEMFGAYKAAGVNPDIAAALAWDPGLLVIDALRTLGTGATAEQIRAHIAGQKGWAGINGIYDFTKEAQRGLDVTDCVVTRWIPAKNEWVIVSKPGGAPL
jgi:branched-chain amino acid transport system substrate-binding protein